MNSTALTATIYCRISEDKTGEEAGVDRQRDECIEFCERNGWDVGEVLVDNDISATSGKTRPAFERLLASEPELIVCWHTDRLIRMTADLERVLTLGTNVHALHAGHFDLSTPAGRAVARTLTAWATYEGEQKALRQVAANRQKAAAGKAFWPMRPFGYGEDGTLRPDEAGALRRCYDGLFAGRSVSSMAKELTERGFVTAHGKPFRPQSLRSILMAARNAGIRTHNGEEVAKGEWTPLVSEDTWRSAVAILDAPGRGARKGGRIPRSLLSGIAHCGVCGENMVTNWRRNGAGEYQVYVCVKSGCASLPVEFLDGVVERRLVERVEHWAPPEGGEGVDTSALIEEEAVLTGRLSALTAMFMDGKISEQQLLDGTARQQARLDEIRAELGSARKVDPLNDLDLERVWLEWVEKGLEERRALVSRLLRDVRVLPRPGGGTRPSEAYVAFEWH